MVLRTAGAALVLTAAAVVVLSVLTALAGWPFWPVAVTALLGLVVVLLGVWWGLRRAYVVRLDALGYQVRLVRGAGVARARWADVARADTAEVHGLACVVLGLRDGGTTTVPVALLGGSRDAFVSDVRERLRR